jgi:hypothetical protein
MSRVAALVALVVAVGCADDGDREVYDFPAAPETQEAASHDEPEPAPEPEATQVIRILENGPLYYDVSGLSLNQQLVVQQLMDRINYTSGVAAVAIDLPNDDKRAYGVIDVHLVGCELAPGLGGFASWNIGKMRSTICIEWKDDRMLLKSIITHELLHTLGIGAHDESLGSVMHDRAFAGQEIMPHHISHIRRLAGLEG